jgi:hypothetical protein
MRTLCVRVGVALRACWQPVTDDRIRLKLNNFLPAGDSEIGTSKRLARISRIIRSWRGGELGCSFGLAR